MEHELSVPDGDQRSAVRALDMDPLEAEVRQVFFFDTPDLALNQLGVILPGRRTKRGDDSAVKLRPVVPSEVSADLRSPEGFGVEVDAMPGGFVCSARMQAKLRPGKVKEAVTGERSLKSLFRADHDRSATPGDDPPGPTDRSFAPPARCAMAWATMPDFPPGTGDPARRP